ncbi:uncharacterized protein LOC126774338 [Nymphalis io]|uniref:uncharacterized protein LOC126774338 n=1 Tax=Inachis io TaxID=171585 RepID=UPI00216964D0|nr:uncharacterized protein LOC126774338 [Nymphalis io]
MLRFVLFIFLHEYCVCENDKYEYIQINDNNFDIYRLFYGDLTNIKDMFLPALDELDDDESDEENTSTTEKPRNSYFEYLNATNQRRDIAEFNEITKLLNNATRRYYGTYHGWIDPQDPRYFSFWTFWWVHEEDKEDLKKDKLIDINIQFLIHTRHQVKIALLEKHEIRLDKRYRIGYLFNRLRRIKYEQQKIVNYASEQLKTDYRDLTSQIRLYEKMVRYDVDITDTIKLIKEIDKEKMNEFTTQFTKPPREEYVQDEYVQDE